MPSVTAKTIAHWHMSERNPQYWDGNGDIPISFDPRPTNNCVQNDIRIDIAFKINDDGNWECCCNAIYEPESLILAGQVVHSINSEENLAAIIDWLIRAMPSTKAKTIANIHMSERNPHRWNGTGSMPAYFDCNPTSHAISDDIRICITFEPSKNDAVTNWSCNCCAIYEPNNQILTAHSTNKIDSEEELAEIINNVILDVTL